MRVRHRVLIVEDGIAADTDAVVEVTGEDLGPGGSPRVLSGDPEAWSTLQALLDREVTPFWMHMR